MSGLPKSLHFGEFSIPMDTDVLFHGSQAIPLEPQGVRVLRYLAENHARIVSKEELLDRVWPDVFTTDSVLKRSISLIRRAIGDNAAKPAFIQTYHGRGYQFIGDVATSEPAIDDTQEMASFERPAGNLPYQASSFVGRGRELTELRPLLGQTPLLTLTGPGGIGKTRLSTELGWSVIRDFPAGVWFIELGEITDPSMVTEAIAAPFDLKSEAGLSTTATLRKALRDSRMLLVLDNCEQVIEECARVVSELLRSNGNLKILATSREALNIHGETIWRVPPMTDRDALALLEARARLAVPSFSLSESAARTAALLCARLEGIPLAIELASARMRMMTIEELLSRIDNQLDMLSRGGHVEPARHRTLRSTIAWSYSLLNEPERALLRRLSVFAGSWSLEAAEAIAQATPGRPSGTGEPARHDGHGSVLDLLGQLVDKSLVVADTAGPASRYSLLESIRRFAREQLKARAEEPETVAAHLAWALDLAERAEPELAGPNMTVWMERIDLDHANMRAAWQAAAESGDVESCARFLKALRVYIPNRNVWSEIAGCMSVALGGLAALPPKTQAETLFATAALALRRHDIDTAIARAEAALALRIEQGVEMDVGRALRTLGLALAERGDHARARRMIEESLVVFRARNDEEWIARAVGGLAYTAIVAGDLDEAAARYEEHIRLSEEANLPRQVAIGLHNLADVAWQRGEFERASEMMSDALARARALTDQPLVGRSLQLLGRIAAALGDVERSLAFLREAASLFHDLGDDAYRALSLETAAVTIAAHDPERAVHLADIVGRFRAARGIKAEDWQRIGFDDVLAAARRRLDERTAARLRAARQQATLDEAIPLAFGETEPRVD